MEALVSLGLATAALALGVLGFGGGMDNFEDRLSFAAAACALLLFALLIGIVPGLGRNYAPDSENQTAVR